MTISTTRKYFIDAARNIGKELAIHGKPPLIPMDEVLQLYSNDALGTARPIGKSPQRDAGSSIHHGMVRDLNLGPLASEYDWLSGSMVRAKWEGYIEGLRQLRFGENNAQQFYDDTSPIQRELAARATNQPVEKVRLGELDALRTEAGIRAFYAGLNLTQTPMFDSLYHRKDDAGRISLFNERTGYMIGFVINALERGVQVTREEAPATLDEYFTLQAARNPDSQRVTADLKPWWELPSTSEKIVAGRNLLRTLENFEKINFQLGFIKISESISESFHSIFLFSMFPFFFASLLRATAMLPE